MNTQAAQAISITLPYLPPASYSANSRAHWSAKRGKRGANHDVLDDVRMLLAEQGWVCSSRYRGVRIRLQVGWHGLHAECRHGLALDQAKITVRFGFPDKRHRDPGSCQERIKPCFDALVRCGLLADDSLEVIGWPEYSHHYSPKQPSTTIWIEEVLEGSA